ncbi:MAG: phage GP46 family protein [Hyphomicrobiales bacterium]|nr:phage GP46 family protein [Hyphomicrobiales bacterium]
MRIRVREAEGCEKQPFLLWDSVWLQRPDATGGYADWLMADRGSAASGGLRSDKALHTATMICLFTDARLPADHPLAEEVDDPRGWWGDSVRLDGDPEAPIGSLLWTLERSPITNETAEEAREICEAALDVLIKQGAVARTEVEVEADKAAGRLLIEVRHFANSGLRAYAQQFDVLWGQEARFAQMNFEG